MKKKLALIMTMSLLLTSVYPVNAAGAEDIEIAEETLSVSAAEDSEDPENEAVEDPGYEITEDPENEIAEDTEMAAGSDLSGADDAASEDLTLAEEDLSGLIEDEEFESGMIGEIYISESAPAGDAEDGWGRAGHGELLLSAASEADGSEYYGSQLSGNQKAMYELLKAGNWVPGEADDSGERSYSIAYSPETDYSFESANENLESNEEYQSIRDKLYSDAFTAFDAYLYDYPEESFWIYSPGFGYSISYYQNTSTGTYHFRLTNMHLNADERWSGAYEQLAKLKSCTDNSVAEIQAVDGYASMPPGEKLKAVHDHICRLVSYGDAENNIEVQHTPFGAYDSKHKVVCEGYSKLFKILVDKLGIADNVLVSGTAYDSNGSGGAHMWNVVSLEERWYLLDATWDDQDKSSTVYYDYFLAGSGSYGFSTDWTVGAQHAAHANLSKYGEEFTTPALSETMYHQRKQTDVTATCTQAGRATIVCGLHPVMAEGSEAAVKTETIPARGHDYGSPVWAWADDYSSATATLTCKHDSTHTETLAAAVTSEITQEASYTAPGERTYTAAVQFNGNEYQDQKTEEIPILSSSGVTDEGLRWEVAEGGLTVSLTDGAQSTEIPDYTSADDAPWAEAAAELNVSKIVVEEGITKVGANSFAGMESLDEISLPQSLEELAEDSVDAAVLSTVNVNYAGSESEWEALTQGTAFQDVNMTSTHTHVWGEWYQKTPATCTADAILERECEICHTTETMTDENTATGHSWGSPSWEWADDYTSATLKLICDNNETHIKTLAGTVTSETTQAATYVMPGVRTHTAVAEYEGEVYQDQTTEAIPELTPSGDTDEGLSWEIADGVLTVSLAKDARSTEIPDYAAAGDAPWGRAVAELSVSKIVVEEGITKVGSNSFAGMESLDEINLPQSLEVFADNSVEDTVLSTVNVNYAGSQSQWEALTRGTALQDVNMTSTHVHTWDAGKITRAATTASAGVKTYTCTCGETRTESIPKLKAAPKAAEKITISKKLTIKKPSAAKGKITVKWKHFKHTSKKTKKIWKPIKSVQIQCATDSGFRNIVKTATAKKSKTSAKIKGLKRKTTYYVRVRYFDGRGYSAWSKVKKVKTK